MVTLIVIFFVVMIALATASWIGYLNHQKLHHTDLMAGDEGDD
jgi:hypothetical protein